MEKNRKFTEEEIKEISDDLTLIFCGTPFGMDVDIFYKDQFIRTEHHEEPSYPWGND